jgi:hypothetical protein
VNRVSGYDPETGICWQFRNPGDASWRCKCPVCVGPQRAERALIMFGRCRSGTRWFWSAAQWLLLVQHEKFGWATSEDEAWAMAIAAVRTLTAGRPAAAGVIHRWTNQKLKELNKAKRAARPAPDTSDARAVEYLYGHYHGSEDCDGHPARFRIIKKTAKRVFYIRHEEPLDQFGEPIKGIKGNDYGIGYIDRQKLETDGFVYNRRASWVSAEFHLYASFEGMMQSLFHERTAPLNIEKLKAEMAAAHPDRGGSSAAFIEARARYVAARRQARSMRTG